MPASTRERCSTLVRPPSPRTSRARTSPAPPRSPGAASPPTSSPGPTASSPGSPSPSWCSASSSAPRVEVERRAHGRRPGARGDVLMTRPRPGPGLLTAERTALNLPVPPVRRRHRHRTLGRPRSRAPARGSATPARPRRASARWRSTPCAAAAGSTTGSRCRDQALVKDNHVLAAGGVVPAYRAVRERYPDLPVQVEVDHPRQLRRAARGGGGEVLLDNMATDDAWPRPCGSRRPGPAGGVRRADPRPRARGRRDRRGLPRGRRAHPLRAGARHRDGPAGGPDACSAPTSATATPPSGLVEDGEVVDHWRLATDERRTADEWGVLVKGLLRDSPVDGDRCAASRSARRCRPCCTSGARCCGRTSPTCRTSSSSRVCAPGVPVLMDNPREVGTDRIVNALAAAQLYGGPRIVVDFGTATTFDVVSATGQYVGGAIAPGIEISLEALGRRGCAAAQGRAAAPAVGDREEHRRGAAVAGSCSASPARSTALVGRMLAELGLEPGEANVIATGGLAPMVVAECSRPSPPTSPG